MGREKNSQLHKKKIIIIGPMIRIAQEIQCLPYAGFLIMIKIYQLNILIVLQRGQSYTTQ